MLLEFESASFLDKVQIGKPMNVFFDLKSLIVRISIILFKGPCATAWRVGKKMIFRIQTLLMSYILTATYSKHSQ